MMATPVIMLNQPNVVDGAVIIIEDDEIVDHDL